MPEQNAQYLDLSDLPKNAYDQLFLRSIMLQEMVTIAEQQDHFEESQNKYQALKAVLDNINTSCLNNLVLYRDDGFHLDEISSPESNGIHNAILLSELLKQSETNAFYCSRMEEWLIYSNGLRGDDFTNASIQKMKEIASSVREICSDIERICFDTIFERISAGIGITNLQVCNQEVAQNTYEYLLGEYPNSIGQG